MSKTQSIGIFLLETRSFILRMYFYEINPHQENSCKYHLTEIKRNVFRDTITVWWGHETQRLKSHIYSFLCL